MKILEPIRNPKRKILLIVTVWGAFQLKCLCITDVHVWSRQNTAYGGWQARWSRGANSEWTRAMAREATDGPHVPFNAGPNGPRVLTILPQPYEASTGHEMPLLPGPVRHDRAHRILLRTLARTPTSREQDNGRPRGWTN